MRVVAINETHNRFGFNILSARGCYGAFASDHGEISVGGYAVSGHGHVTPNENGSRARCGGPGICPQCSIEACLYRQPNGNYQDVDKMEAVEEAVDPLLSLLFAVVHGRIGQNADGEEMIRLHPADYKRIKEAVEKE